MSQAGGSEGRVRDAEHPSGPRATVAFDVRRTTVDAGVLAVLCLVASLGFGPAFGSSWYLLATAGGLLVGLGAAIAGSALRLNLLNTLLVAVVAYFLLGTAFVQPNAGFGGVLPTLSTLADLARAPVFAWRDAVTLSTPLLVPAHLAVLPYFVTALASLTSLLLLLRVRPTRADSSWPAALALLGPLSVLASAIFIGTEDSVWGATRGGVIAIVAVAWLAWRRGSSNVASPEARRSLARSKLTGTLALALVAAAVTAGGGLVAGATVGEQRLVARSQLTPPFDPLTHTSPLAGFREYSKLEPDTVLFEATGLERGDRIRLATLESYSGKSWQIAEPDDDAAATGSYSLSGRTVPSSSFLTSSSDRTVDITIRGYSDIWLPSVGQPSDVHFLGGSLPERAGDLRYNPRSGGGLVTSGLRDGDRYAVTARIQDLPVEGQLDNSAVAPLDFPAMPAAPAALVERMQGYVAGETSPYLQLKAIENALVAEGYLSHGTASDSAPSRAGHGIDRMQELFELRYLVGDEEQYASAMAIMARQLGYPARVVMGYAPDLLASSDASGLPGTTEIRGTDVTAWVEVPFEGFGWVAFNPTPEQTDVPVNTTTDPQSKPKAQVRQPPQTQEKPDELLTSADERRQEEGPEDEERLPDWIVAVGVSLAVPLLLFLAPALVVALLKRRRRGRRRNRGSADEQAAGAWSESIDNYAELGYRVSERRTRLQTAHELHPSLVSIATASDRAVFSGSVPDTQELETLWSAADASVAQARADAGIWRRLRARFAFRSAPGAVSLRRGAIGVHRSAAGNDRPGGERA